MSSAIRTRKNRRFITKDSGGKENGFLVPIYNNNDHFFETGKEPKQAYLTTVRQGCSKGPHLHFIRTGFFTCIKGNVKIVLKVGAGGYEEYYSGEDHEYLSVEVPTGVAALIVNIGEEEAFVLNMPNPAWTPEMDDEHSADFNDYFGKKEN